MGKPVARESDQLSGDRGAPQVTIKFDMAKTVLINGKPCALDESKGPVHGHPLTHPDFVQPTIIASSGTVLVEGKKIARKDDICQCSSVVLTGSENVLAG